MHTRRRAVARRIVGRDKAGSTAVDLQIPARLPNSEISFSHPGTPLVSVLIPVHNQINLTLDCLSSLSQTTGDIAFEVLVGDDHSADSTQEVLRNINGIKVVRHGVNKGFLRNVNHLAAQAKGRYLVVLNNDTVLLPGWLEPLLEVLQNDPSVGIAGPALLNERGVLQDAGGIIFSDGTASNFGRGMSPNSPEVSYLREVDYVTGAVLAIRKEYFFEVFGGFDDRYTPAYYEDTDLAMEARLNGLSAKYVPKSRVIHFEGGSHGRDITSGVKRYQELNRIKFVDKWEPILVAEHSDPKNFCAFRASRRLEGKKGTVIFIDDFPDRRHASGSVRSFGFVKQLVQRGYSVVFIATSNPRDTLVADELSMMGVMVALPECNWLPLIQSVSEDISLIVVARSTNGEIVRQLVLDKELNSIPLVFDTVDLDFLRIRRGFELAGHLSRDDEMSTRLLEKNTREVISLATVVTVVTEVEREIILSTQPDAEVHVLTNMHRFLPIDFNPGNHAERVGLLFVANFQHPPNLDGIIWFLNKIYPQITRQRLVPLRIVGANPPRMLRRLSSQTVHLLDWVEDLTDLYANSLAAIAPLRFGAGVKGKITEAWANGLPVVGTSIAFEGMLPPGDNHGGLVADSPEAIATALMRLSEDQEFWLARRSDIEKYRVPYSEEVFGTSLDRILSQARKARLSD